MRGRFYLLTNGLTKVVAKNCTHARNEVLGVVLLGSGFRSFETWRKPLDPQRWRHYGTSKRREVLAHQHSLTSETTNLFHHKHILVTVRSLYFVVDITIKCTISPLILTLCWHFLTCFHFLHVPSFTTLFKVKQHYISTVCVFLFISVESSELNNTFQGA